MVELIARGRARRSIADGDAADRHRRRRWRPDLRDPYDYVEEVGRLVGFDTIEPVVPRGARSGAG